MMLFSIFASLYLSESEEILYNYCMKSLNTYTPPTILTDFSCNMPIRAEIIVAQKSRMTLINSPDS